MESFEHLIRTSFAVLLDIGAFTRLRLRPTTALAAKNLFLRKQLGLFVDRKIKPRRATHSIVPIANYFQRIPHAAFSNFRRSRTCRNNWSHFAYILR